jgi:NodT family efflux transporter outer membrane factor (OMF) lipoprotein
MAIFFGLAGCASVGPDFVPPNLALPVAFHDSGASATVVDDSRERVSAWWRTLHDPELDRLVNTAIVANTDIEAALDRIQQAREHEIAVLGSALPQVGAAIGGAEGTGTDSVKPPRTTNSLDAAVNATGFNQITGVAGFDAVWELDLFGKYRREFEAAHYKTLAAVDQRNAVIVRVVAEVARNYAIVRGLQLRMRFLIENIDKAKNEVSLTETRYHQGLTSEGDLLLAQRELEALNSTVPSLRASIYEAQSHIAILLGTFSGDVIGILSRYHSIPRTPDRIRLGEPADLLRRRPDILIAERELATATARIGVAAAELFPRAVVNAGAGVQGGRVGSGSSSPNNPGFIWSAGPGLYWPLLDFGRLDATLKEAEFREREGFASYRGAVIAAVDEVNAAVVRYRSAIESRWHLSGAVEVSRRALDFHTGRYEQGIEDFLNVLDASRQLYQLQDRYADAQLSVILAYIELYKALGGGWELFESIPQIPLPQPAIASSIRVLTQGH